MNGNKRNSKKGVALFLTMFLMLTLMSCVSLSAFQYVNDNFVQQYYENNIKEFYSLETAKVAALWEQANNSSWSTTGSNTTPALQGATVSNGNYSIAGTNFQAKVTNSNGVVKMYVKAFTGTATNPLYPVYLEYIHSPNPMYQYMIFNVQSLSFGGAALYDCKGGRIHTNADIVFYPSGQGIRFHNINTFTASGTIKYANRYQYPAPHILDQLDTVDSNANGSLDASEYNASNTNFPGMASAPAVASPHNSPTSGDSITAPATGPYLYTAGSGLTKSISWKWYGDWLGSAWGGSAPIVLLGEETYFYGNQFGGSAYNTDEKYYDYLQKDGTIGYGDGTKLANVYWFSLNYTSNSLSSYLYAWGYHRDSNVHFQPSFDKNGNPNDKWFEIPGALPQYYNWTTKYAYKNTTETPVVLYATEKCDFSDINNNSGCLVDTNGSASNAIGWRYIKADNSGNVCINNTCYNDANSAYVKAKDYYVPGATIIDNSCVSTQYTNCLISSCPGYGDYINCINNCDISGGASGGGPGFIGKGGGDCYYNCYLNTPQSVFNCTNANYSTCYSNALSACTFAAKYFDKISPYSYDKNDDFFSNNYTYGHDANNSSSWQIRVFDAKNQPDAFTNYLNLLAGYGISGVINAQVEPKTPFLGSIFDITGTPSVYSQRAQANGIYIDNIDTVVAQLNNGLTPEQQFAKKVTFWNWKTSLQITLIDLNLGKMIQANKAPADGVIYSKVPIRLSNAATLPGSNSSDRKAVFTVICEQSIYLKGDYNTTDWKISNLSTKKKIYALSNNFSDPQALPDFSIYKDYPYVYVQVSGEQYLQQEGDPLLSNGIWVDATAVSNTSYYIGMSNDVRTWVVSTEQQHQSDYKVGKTFPNTVDKDYSYCSLFLTPYDGFTGDSSLENWSGRTKHFVGAFINFDDGTGGCSYHGVLGSEEATWNYRGYRCAGCVFGNTVSSPSVDANYDDRFPQAVPNSTDGVLGFSGGESYRIISQDYYNSQTGS